MLTWAIVFLMAHSQTSGDVGALLIIAMACDVIIVAISAAAYAHSFESKE
jgi:hypothetical protein